MSQILPIAVRHVLDENVKQALFKISCVFQRLCTRKVVLAKKDAYIAESAIIVCLLEQWFPPIFMNIMP